MMKRTLNSYFPVLLTAVFVTVAFLVHQQVVSFERYASDTDEHIIILYRVIFEPGYYISHPLWHIVTYAVSKILRIDVETAAAVSSAAFVTFWTWLVYYTVKSRLNSSGGFFPVAVAAIVVVVGPLCIPWFHKIIFLGSPNIWHNVTLWAVKPFALMTLLFLFYAIRSDRNIFYFLSLASALVSIFAKPSFIIMYLPALLIFALSKKLFTRKFLIHFFLLGSLSVVILAYQYMHTFHNGESKIIIDWLGVWSRAVPDVTYSIVMLLAFPLAFLLFESEIIHDDAVMLSWLMVFVGMFYYAVFAQTGRFYSHGNFGWSYMIAVSLLYLFSIVKFFEIFSIMPTWKRIFLSALLLIQTGIGGYYLLKVLEGQNPLYIAIFI